MKQSLTGLENLILCCDVTAPDHCHDLQNSNATDFVSDFDPLVVPWEIKKWNLLEKKFSVVFRFELFIARSVARYWIA